MNTLYNKEDTMKKLNSKEVIDFLEKYNIITVIVFGSILSDNFNEESDVDIALLSQKKIKMDNILDLEMFMQKVLNREIDILDLNSDNIDLFLKINILNNGKVIYSKDNCKTLNILYDETDRLFKENENFIHFRKVDVLS